MGAKVRVVLCLTAIVAQTLVANAWMDQWAPDFKCTPVKIAELPSKSVSNFVISVVEDATEGIVNYSKGGVADLNGDGVNDFVFIIPWMGCGLNASGYDAHFLVSDGAKGRVETVVPGYDIELGDIVNVSGKTYFRHSSFMYWLGGSRHNYWVYQVFAFDANGVMRCANADFGNMFPAATIFYKKPKFKRVELTADDLKKIVKETRPHSQKYVPK